MSKFPFKTVFLPAIIASGAVFVIFTLPLSLVNAAPQWLSPRLDISTESSPDASAKPLIRYVGLSIVVSVGVGTGTAELLRRLQRKWQLRLDQAAAEPQQSPAQPQGLPKEITAQATPLPTWHESEDTASAVDFDALIQAARQSEQGLNESRLVQTEAVTTDLNLELTCLQFPEEVEPMYLQMPDNDQVTFGLRYQDTYYRLVRTTDERTRAAAWSRQLTEAGQGCLVTQSDWQYAIWLPSRVAKPLTGSQLSVKTRWPQHYDALPLVS